MRHKIPFKAWDKQNKKWICDWTKGLPAHYKGTKYPIEHGGIDYMCIYVHTESGVDDCELVFVTNKKDKNGKIICEGDILKYESNIYKLGHETPYVITWDDEELCFECKNKGNFMLPSAWCEMEIIGNVFENPELLVRET